MNVPRTEVPAEFREQEPMMTAPQKDYLLDLIEGREMTDDARAEALERLEGGLTRRQASDWITKARGLPRRDSQFSQLKEVLPDVPDGYYAIDIDGTVKFYRLDTGKDTGRWAGFRFLSVQASDDFHPIKGLDTKRRVLEAILKQKPEEAAKRYGIEIGSCGVCGRTLTDETSRAYGIGPVCRDKTGW